MERDPQEKLARAFKHLQAGREQYISSELSKTHGDKWERLALRRFPSGHPIHENFTRNRRIDWDIAALLAVIDARWRYDFERKLGREARNWVKELRTARNQWAHQTTMDNELVWRAIDSGERLLHAADITDYAALVEKEKIGLLNTPVKIPRSASIPKPPTQLATQPTTRTKNQGVYLGSDTVFQLCLGATYFRSGFFNISVKFDRFVRPTDGEITIKIEPEGTHIQAMVNRRANTNGTPRIMGGVPLRDWFQRSCKEKQTLYIDFPSKTHLRISKSPLAQPS